MKAHFISFVSDQARSTEFYSSTLGQVPTLNVPGMTEFSLSEETVLGLMPDAGIVRLLGSVITHPSKSRRAHGSELYLVVQDAVSFHARAIAAGARELSPLTPRDWGHFVAYSLDPDGHLLAFAESGRFIDMTADTILLSDSHPCHRQRGSVHRAFLKVELGRFELPVRPKQIQSLRAGGLAIGADRGQAPATQVSLAFSRRQSPIPR